MKMTGKKFPAGSKQTTPTGRSTETTVSEITSPFHDRFSEVRKLLKSGASDKSLLSRVKELHKIVDADAATLRDEDEIHYLKAKAFICEVYDCFGCIEESRQVIQEGGEIFKRLPYVIESATPLKERKLLREKVRFCLGWANAEYYRARRYHKARDVVSRIRQLVQGLITPAIPCFGTMGQIGYYLGKIYKQLGMWDDAEENFAEAIEYYHRRAEHKRQLIDDPREANVEVNFALHRSAICLGLGIGWVNHTRAHLTRALRNNIIPAGIFLLNTNDELNQASLNLILGAINRSLAKNIRGIGSSVEPIQKAYDVFAYYGHRRYLAKAAYCLSLAYFYGENLKIAGEKLVEVMKIARELNDVQWQANSLILQSRIKCRLKEYKVAEEDASQAYELGDEHDQVLCKIDALLARGGARLQLGKHIDARADFNEALDLNRRQPAAQRTAETANPRIEALCHLNLAYSHALEHEGRKARSHFKQWEEMRKEVEDRRVYDTAAEVSRAISKLSDDRDFVIERIDFDDPKFQRREINPDNPKLQHHLDYKANLRRLQQYLVRQARELSEEKQDIAKLLGISRQTLFQWEKEWQSEKASQKE